MTIEQPVSDLIAKIISVAPEITQAAISYERLSALFPLIIFIASLFSLLIIYLIRKYNDNFDLSDLASILTLIFSAMGIVSGVLSICSIITLINPEAALIGKLLNL